MANRAWGEAVSQGSFLKILFLLYVDVLNSVVSNTTLRLYAIVSWSQMCYWLISARRSWWYLLMGCICLNASLCGLLLVSNKHKPLSYLWVFDIQHYYITEFICELSWDTPSVRSLMVQPMSLISAITKQSLIYHCHKVIGLQMLGMTFIGACLSTI